MTATLRQLRLLEVADTLIGSEARRGVSGGERKRCAIGEYDLRRFSTTYHLLWSTMEYALLTMVGYRSRATYSLQLTTYCVPRCAIGVELVSRPRMLFLDEPTSGLDAATALLLV